MDSLTQGILPQCECLSGHHDVYSKHLTSLSVSYTSVELKLISLKKERNQSHSGPLHSFFFFLTLFRLYVGVRFN